MRPLPTSDSIDSTFLDLPLATLIDAALDRAGANHATHAECRIERTADEVLRIRDRHLEGAHESRQQGVGVRVLINGTWGFAATTTLTPEAVAAAADHAVLLAQLATPLNTEPVELSPEPTHHASWSSHCTTNPFGVPRSEKVELLTNWTHRLLDEKGIDHADAGVMSVQENKCYADLSGTTTIQQRVRLHPHLTLTTINATSGAFETMRTLAPPTARGWEYLRGEGWDWEAELAHLPELLREKLLAPSVKAGSYDCVIAPSNLWLTIHESIGHATELDRALGYEAAYAGTSFAKFPMLGTLQYGSQIMHITGDRTTEHGLATIGFDDEGVETQSWDIVRDGVLVGYQLNRDMAKRTGFARSNGCAFADSAAHVPLQRMANVSLQPGSDETTTADLVEDIEDGIYIEGDKSWSIDMQRYNFQFTGQRFFHIKHGKIAGQLKDVIYQGTTTQFWGSMERIGGRSTYVLGGALNCGKGQPGQVASVSHGCPSALFRKINILNAVEEGRA